MEGENLESKAPDEIGFLKMQRAVDGGGKCEIEKTDRRGCEMLSGWWMH